MKKRSTFDVVSEGSWESHGSVTFPSGGIVSQMNGKQLRAGFYPCFGVTFVPEVLDDVQLETTPRVYHWDTASQRILCLEHPPTKPRKLRLTITKNPSKEDAAAFRTTIATAIAADPTKKDYTPHVRMDDDFVKAFNNLVFDEIAQDLLVSNPMELDEVKVYGRDGEPYDGGVETGRFNIVFHMTHVETTEFGNVMMTRAEWGNGYIALYGCCRAAQK